MSRPLNVNAPAAAGSDRATSSSQKVDLRTVIVPPTLWEPQQRCKLVSVDNEAQTIGFVRVFPDVTLSSLRHELHAQLEADSLPSVFVFLRNVGNYLALVSGKQESKLTAKSFLPPSNKAPEIYLLPVDGLSNTSLSSDDGWGSLSSLSGGQLQSYSHLQPVERATASPAAALSIPPQQPVLHRTQPHSNDRVGDSLSSSHTHMAVQNKRSPKAVGDSTTRTLHVGEGPLAGEILAKPGNLSGRKDVAGHSSGLSGPSTYTERYQAQQEALKNTSRTNHSDRTSNLVNAGKLQPTDGHDLVQHETARSSASQFNFLPDERTTQHFSSSHQAVEPLFLPDYPKETLPHDNQHYAQQPTEPFVPHPPISPRDSLLYKPRSPRLSPRPDSVQALQSDAAFSTISTHTQSSDSGISSGLAQPALPPVGQWAQPSPLQVVLTRGGNQVALQVHNSPPGLPAVSPRSPSLTAKHFDIHISPSPQPHLLFDDKVHVLAHSKQPLPPVGSSLSPPYNAADSSISVTLGEDTLQKRNDSDQQVPDGSAERLLSPPGAFASREAAMRQQLQELEQLKTELQATRERNEQLALKRKTLLNDVATQQAADNEEWKRLYQQERKHTKDIEKDVEQLQQELKATRQKAVSKRQAAAGNLRKNVPGQSDHHRAGNPGSTTNNFRTLCYRLEDELNSLRQKKDSTEACLKKEQEALRDVQHECKELREKLTQKKIARSLMEKSQ